MQARRAHEDAKAHIARLKLQRMRGELVDRNNAIALVFQLAREERDSWLNWPARVAALMAAELGIDAHTMQKVLETHVRAMSRASLSRGSSSGHDDDEDDEKKGAVIAACCRSGAAGTWD